MHVHRYHQHSTARTSAAAAVPPTQARGACLKHLHEYVKALPAAFVRADPDAFTSDCKKILTLLFPPRKREPELEERPVAAAIVVAMGRQHPPFAFNELQLLLGAREYSAGQKATLCRALGTLVREFPREVAAYNPSLGAMCFNFMGDQDEGLASHAIRTFPYVLPVRPDGSPDEEAERRIVQRVLLLIVTAEAEVTANAFESLTTYLMQACPLPSRRRLCLPCMCLTPPLY